MTKSRGLLFVLISALLLAVSAFAQETTAGLQGTVKDQSGAVVGGAQVVITGTTLVGNKTTKTDGNGYYRFANLPPGTYSMTVSSQGFSTYKQEGLILEVGHLPSVDVSLQVGKTSEIVEVSGEAPVIDVTTTHTINNITEDVITNVPVGRSYQSVIQFAPAARNEPLAGNNSFYGAGTGGGSISSSSNGNSYGFSVAGAADSENSYLVEGQDTSNIASGYSNANVPFEFIQEVQVKSSGIEAEHGGALGGVANVIMRKGGSAYHGQLFANWEGDKLDAIATTAGFPNAYPRYDPTSSGSPAIQVDGAGQLYQPKKDHFRVMQLGGTLGGPIVKDRLWFFLGFEPQIDTLGRNVNFGAANSFNPQIGMQGFHRSVNTYYGTGRLDGAVSKKVHVFASWLYQYAREVGSILPNADSTVGLFNTSVGSPVTNYPTGAGWSAPNQTANVGADITLTQNLVATTRFGYFYDNYHDFGFPTGFPAFSFNNNGAGQPCNGSGCPSGTIPSGSPLGQPSGFSSALLNSNYTGYNLNKHYQFDQDIAWFKSGLLGTHNFKFGYQLNRLYNSVLQNSNLPQMIVLPGTNQVYSPQSTGGKNNCAALEAQTGLTGKCTGNFGYGFVYDTGTDGKASNYNHGLFAQDAWTIARGLTLNLGVRADKEYLPAYQAYEGLTAKPINFSWSDKLAPRIGAAYDVFKDGRMKIFGSYGVYYDTMKLNLAISSFGGQYWNNCYYAINTNDLSQVNISYNAAGRACFGLDPTVGASFSGTADPNLTFIENINNRNPEYVIPNLKPYRQHDSAFGVDYELRKGIALEARWDRRRLDRAIEDAAMFNISPAGSEVYIIVNPGFSPNDTFNNFVTADYALNDRLYGCSTPGSCPTGAAGALTQTLSNYLCPSCPLPPKAARSYDGVELRLTKTTGKLQGMFSYTYSSLRGNYSGLTSTDVSDSSGLTNAGGRASPNNSRYFDEPWFSYTANGTLANGPLPTDRPNVFKGYGYYTLPWHWKGNSTSMGIFQYLYQGSPLTTYADVGYYYSGFGGQIDQYIVGRGNWVNATQDQSCVAAGLAGGTTDCPITVNGIGPRRTPWYIQSDLQLQHEVKLTESKSVRFEVTASNAFNQHSVTSYVQQLDSGLNSSYIAPNGLTILDESAFYAAAMHKYDWKSQLNIPNYLSGVPITLNGNYGKPLYYQLPRTMRFAVRYIF